MWKYSGTIHTIHKQDYFKGEADINRNCAGLLSLHCCAFWNFATAGPPQRLVFIDQRPRAGFRLSITFGYACKLCSLILCQLFWYSLTSWLCKRPGWKKDIMTKIFRLGGQQTKFNPNCKSTVLTHTHTHLNAFMLLPGPQTCRHSPRPHILQSSSPMCIVQPQGCFQISMLTSVMCFSLSCQLQNWAQMWLGQAEVDLSCISVVVNLWLALI